MKSLISKIENDTHFINIVNNMIENDTVQQMKNYRQHCNTSCFDHCLVASYYSYLICKKFNLDYVSGARASLVHDLFLYDWRTNRTNDNGLHAFTHPKTAYLNASKIFDLNTKEKDIILKHMWPVTFTFPKYKESFVLIFVDKYCAISESFKFLFSNSLKKKLLRFSYVYFSILFLYSYI